MKNNNYLKTSINEKNSAAHKRILLLLIFSYFIVFTGIIFAQEADSAELSEMEVRSLETRTATQEPDFFVSGTSAQWLGFYFGVGFRKVKLEVADAVIISDSDGTANGIGFNLGYFWDEEVVEYERQISIVEHSNSFTYQGETGQKLEVIQNNFWYSQYPKFNRDFYLHYGAGLQFTKTRFAGTESNDSYKDEIALGIETGVSYFVTSNLLIYYRFSVGQQLPFLTASASSPFLKQSQLHTIYLNYYYPL
ncbi:MAG: outer membrane beta-barrel protein [SAR324 cluster bacterium]|jgi:hypothetical protein|nr:outer membrane beta-barrel protein [SAR324 cluster bacterium]